MAIDTPPRETLPERIAQAMVADIDAGRLKPGEWLPGDRVLAERYGAGRSSMIAALRRLQRDGYIERLPTRGTYIRKDAHALVSRVNIAYALPATSMLPETIGYNSFLVAAETQQGLVADGVDHNFNVLFHHFPETDDRLQLQRQLEALRESADAVVFVGHQFPRLKERVFHEGLPALVIMPNPFWGNEALPCITFDRAQAMRVFAAHVAATGRKSLGFLYLNSPYEADRLALQARMREAEALLVQEGVDVRYFGLPYGDLPDDALYQALAETLPARREDCPAVLCGSHYQLFSMLQRLLCQRGWDGENGIVTTSFVCVGMYAHLYPAVPYVRVPCYEMARLASRTLVDAVRHRRPIPPRQEVPTRLWIANTPVDPVVS